MIGTGGGQALAAGRSVALAPLLVAAAIICLISVVNLHRLVTATAPRNPWESVEILEAWRSLQGMPVYENAPNGHATHMYGALVPWVQGQIFRWVGPNNVSGRLLSVFSSVVTVALLALGLRGEKSAWYLLVAWATILGVNHRSGQYFAENRPDMPALMFGTAALFLLGWGLERKRWPAVVAGSLFLVVGFFFKQTVLVLAAVPLLVLALRFKRPSGTEAIAASIPLAVMSLVIITLKLTSPTIYHYMMEVPGAYAINWPRAVKFLWELLLDSPLFLVLIGEWIVSPSPAEKRDPRAEWLLASLAVTIPFAAISHAKVGGWPNSLLPALLAMTGFCVLRLPSLVKRIEGVHSSSRSRLAFGSFLAVLLLMTTFPHLTREHSLIVSRSPWDRDYQEAVAVARALAGTVVCPEDPTIPFYGSQFVGHNLFSEKDARADRGAWPKATPEPVLAELARADYVLDVTNYWGENVDEVLLEELGFEGISIGSLDPACYRLWRRRQPRTFADRMIDHERPPKR
jgi:hypothetical protein